MKSKGALDKIAEIYGKTTSLEGTYNYFLAIKKDLEKLEKIENVDKMWKQPSRKINDCEAMCRIDEILHDEN